MNDPPGWLAPALVAVPALVLAVFYAWPFGALLARVVDADSVVDVVRDPDTREVVWYSTWQAALSTALTLAVAIGPAVVLGRYRFRGRTLLLGLLTATFVLPTVVMAAAVDALAPDGVGGTAAVVVAHVLFNIAVVVRIVGASVAASADGPDHAAATLGAGPWRRFVDVTLPSVRGAVAAAGAIVFVFCFTSFGVVRVLGDGRATVEVEIWRRATVAGDVDAAAVLAVVQLVVVGLVLALTARRGATGVPADAGRGARRVQRAGERRAVVAAASFVAVATLVPIAAMVARSLRGSDGWSTTAWRTLGRQEVRPGISLGVDPWDALLTSLRTAAWATAFAVAVGGLAIAAITVARRLGRALDAVLLLPLATSAVTVGLGMLIAFDEPPADWRASWWLLPVGQAMVAIPFVVRAAADVARRSDPDRLAAAAVLGASPLRAWATVALPVLWRPLLAGTGLAAAVALGEFGATSVLSRTGTVTAPVAIERLLARPGALAQSQGYALATLLAALTVAIVVLVEWIGRARRT
ncbi:MAG: ABC transporter permease subunit [Ilumatobacteraceae bacterium]|nr:ABC transporter permease subunit [Ilumatobacteraceae bacterium]